MGVGGAAEPPKIQKQDPPGGGSYREMQEEVWKGTYSDQLEMECEKDHRRKVDILSREKKKEEGNHL